MLGADVIEAYHRDGFILVPDLLDQDILRETRDVIARLVAESASVTEHTDIYDLEPGHSAAEPRVRRIKAPNKVHPVFDRIVRTPEVIAILETLLGPSVRLHGAKLNMKSARYGSPVEWHQDWAFYPHTNDDILAIGVLLDDTSLENGPLLCVPGSHRGPVHNHHGSDGRFAGMINPAELHDQIPRAVPMTGRAGSMSFHHVRTLHGSAQNTSNRSRNLLLYEVAAADAWPLKGVPDLAEFDSRLLTGSGPTIEPRLAPVPVRFPLPPPTGAGSIYETQARASASTYFRQQRPAA